jgi:hypothetical protein
MFSRHACAPKAPTAPGVRYHFVMFKSGSSGSRMKLSVLAAAVVLPAAVVLASAAGANPGGEAAAPVADEALTCCSEMLAAPQSELVPDAVPDAFPDVMGDAVPAADMEAVPDALPEPVVIQAAHVDQVPRSLPVGVASERGMQVKTILVGRSVSAAFPQIRTMIGVRPDAKPWHPSGLAVDIMIPNAGSAEGIALGDAILAYAMTNAGRFGVQDVIWRGTYYTPGGGASGSGYGHFDHVHITTTGGGYPSGNEEYLAD